MESLARPARYILTGWQFIGDRVVDKDAQTPSAPEQGVGSQKHLVAVKGATQSEA